MTQSAVSQHVRALEDWTGRRLIARGRQSSLPTREGQRLARAVAQGVAEIEDAIQELRPQKAQQNSVTVACPAGFAVNWLFPRLYKFDQAHPEIPVSVLTQTAGNLGSEAEVDVAILYAPTPPLGLKAVKLLGEKVFPVCSPALQGGKARICATADLVHHTLLVDSYEALNVPPPDWNFWGLRNRAKPARRSQDPTIWAGEHDRSGRYPGRGRGSWPRTACDGRAKFGRVGGTLAASRDLPVCLLVCIHAANPGETLR